MAIACCWVIGRSDEGRTESRFGGEHSELLQYFSARFLSTLMVMHSDLMVGSAHLLVLSDYIVLGNKGRIAGLLADSSAKEVLGLIPNEEAVCDLLVGAGALDGDGSSHCMPAKVPLVRVTQQHVHDYQALTAWKDQASQPVRKYMTEKQEPH